MDKSLRPKTDKDFGAPPPGYVAGRGRGASGFASGVSRNAPVKAAEEKEGDLGDSNYDEFAGYSGSLFQGGAFDKEDDEADRIYDMVESRMEGRRKKARLQQEQEDLAKLRSERPNLQQQFVDLKRELLHVSEDQWMQLPTAHERLKAKKVQKESVSNATDSMLLGAPPGMPGSMTEVGEAKRAVLSVNLDRESSGLGVDAEDYLSELSAKSSETFSDIAEVKKARLLFRSVTKADPENPTGWIAAARLEEATGNPADAKAIVARGLAHCETSEDLWLMAVRLEQSKDKLKAIVANGIRKNPRSLKLWQEAAHQEVLKENKIRVFQKALEIIPSAVPLWKSLINLMPADDRAETLLLLERAVQCCPESEEMWLTYAKLSDFEKAQKILNEARRAIPTSVSVWIAAAELAEAMHASEKVIESILAKGIESLGKNGVVLEKNAWLDVASSKAGSSVSVPVILTGITVRRWVESRITAGMEMKEVKREILKNHQTLPISSVAEALLAAAVHETVLAARKGLWVRYLTSLMLHAPASRVETEFSLAVSACPQAEVLWLMFAKFFWSNQKNAEKARQVLQRAVEQIPHSEDIYIALGKIAEFFGIEETRKVFSIARSRCPKSCRLWLKAAELERRLGNVQAAVSICESAIDIVGRKTEYFFKIFLVACHALLEANLLDQAFAFAARAVDACPLKAAVWAVAADIAIAQKDLNRARSILERGRVRLATDELLWYKGFQVENICHGQSSLASKSLLSRALQACPHSGLLWACAIETEPVATRHPKCLDALKRCPNEALVVSAVARFFWIEKLQLDKARKWFLNALQLGKEHGQVWADLLAFEASQGDQNLYNLNQFVIEKLNALDQSCLMNKGFAWNAFRKQVRFWNAGGQTRLVVEFAKSLYPTIFSNLEPETAASIESLGQTQPLKAEID